MSIVSTIGKKCKKCYACIKSCPAKAIKVSDGKASVIEERCISCGHCITVCSQNAKIVKSDFEPLQNDILNNEITAIVAPSFIISFPEFGLKVVTALKKLGFKHVFEVGFGADLVSMEYQKYLAENNGKTIIATPCPAIVKYIQKYEPELIEMLAPIVSPMIAIARVVKRIHPSNRIAFIGPCVAKIEERVSFGYDDVDYAITFEDLKLWIVENKVDFAELCEEEFEPPRANLGAIYPVTGGLLKCSTLKDDVIEFDTIVTEGRRRVHSVIDSLKKGSIKGKFIDILFCLGCIEGPKICSELNYFEKKSRISEYVRSRLNASNKEEWAGYIEKFKSINLRTDFRSENVREMREASPAEIKKVLMEMGKNQPQDELNCGACGYGTCRANARAIIAGFAEKEMCLPYLIEKLEENLNLLKNSNDMLKTTQNELIQKEKLASLGQMAAGVAHEINNPLGTVLLYAHMLIDQVKNDDLKDDVKTIISEINRTKEIITGMLSFARENKLTISSFNFLCFIEEIVEKYQKNFNSLDANVSIELNCAGDFVLEADQSAIGQVFSNLLSNAKDAIVEARRPMGKILINVLKNDEDVTISFTDNGTGIEKEKISKLFTPFFTTKGYGKGTGLGLPVTYGIIKMHRGKIAVESVCGESTTFRITLPLKNSMSVSGLLG